MIRIHPRPHSDTAIEKILPSPHVKMSAKSVYQFSVKDEITRFPVRVHTPSNAKRLVFSGWMQKKESCQ